MLGEHELRRLGCVGRTGDEYEPPLDTSFLDLRKVEPSQQDSKCEAKLSSLKECKERKLIYIHLRVSRSARCAAKLSPTVGQFGSCTSLCTAIFFYGKGPIRLDQPKLRKTAWSLRVRRTCPLTKCKSWNESLEATCLASRIKSSFKIPRL